MRLIKIKEVMLLTSLGRSAIYKFIKEGKFPEQVKLTAKAVAWVESEIHDWIEEAVQNRDTN